MFPFAYPFASAYGLFVSQLLRPTNSQVAHFLVLTLVFCNYLNASEVE